MVKVRNVLLEVCQVKDIEKAVDTDYEWIILLATRLAQLRSLVTCVKRKNKQVIVHVDLVQGVAADEYGVEFIARDIQPDGIISTRGTVIEHAKRHKLLAIQRLFLLDTLSLDSNVKLTGRSKADYTEVL